VFNRSFKNDSLRLLFEFFEVSQVCARFFGRTGNETNNKGRLKSGFSPADYAGAWILLNIVDLLQDNGKTWSHK
jgi:hypothetical protein